MITPSNWLFFSDGLQFQSYEEWEGPWEFAHPLERGWKESLKNLSASFSLYINSCSVSFIAVG